MIQLLISRNSRSSRSKTAVTAATSSGTTYYSTTLDDAIKALESKQGNILVINELKKSGWDALDLEHHLFGSAVIEDTLYICQTDGQDINVSGDDVDPESALDEYDIELLSAYIQIADQQKIVNSITGYEVTISDINTSAQELLESGTDFLDIVAAADDLGLLE